MVVVEMAPQIWFFIWFMVGMAPFILVLMRLVLAMAPKTYLGNA